MDGITYFVSKNYFLYRIPVSLQQKCEWKEIHRTEVWTEMENTQRGGWKSKSSMFIIFHGDSKGNIQKMKIMASSRISSWQIDGEKMETMTDFSFLGSKITVDGDGSHEIKRHFCSLEEKL